MSEEIGLFPVGLLTLQSIKRAKDKRKRRAIASWTLLGISLALTVLLTILGVIVPALGVAGGVCLTALAGVFQVLSVLAAGDMEISEAFVRQQLVNGVKLSGRLNEMRQIAEPAYEKATPEERRRVLGYLSAGFTHLQDLADLSVYGWIDVRPDVVLDGFGKNSASMAKEGGVR